MIVFRASADAITRAADLHSASDRLVVAHGAGRLRGAAVPRPAADNYLPLVMPLVAYRLLATGAAEWRINPPSAVSNLGARSPPAADNYSPLVMPLVAYRAGGATQREWPINRV
jgi:hypothetical protein